MGQYPGTPFTTGPDGGGLIPTSDGAGEIIAVGESVDEWTIGDRVYSLYSETWDSGPIQVSCLFILKTLVLNGQ